MSMGHRLLADEKGHARIKDLILGDTLGDLLASGYNYKRIVEREWEIDGKPISFPAEYEATN